MPAKQLECSFCGKEQTEIRPLIAGPAVFICSECVALCAEIVAQGPVMGDAWREEVIAMLINLRPQADLSTASDKGPAS